MLAAVEDQNESLLTIGELSKRTGITTHTLRVWEKRYDSPKAIRLPSGHRRYLPKEIERLRAVARTIKLGFRASKVVGGTLEELHNLMGFESNRSSKVSPSTQSDVLQSQYDSKINQWLDWIADFDEENLNFEMHREWGLLGPLSFITNLAAPLITHIGNTSRGKSSFRAANVCRSDVHHQLEDCFVRPGHTGGRYCSNSQSMRSASSLYQCFRLVWRFSRQADHCETPKTIESKGRCRGGWGRCS